MDFTTNIILNLPSLSLTYVSITAYYPLYPTTRLSH